MEGCGYCEGKRQGVDRLKEEIEAEKERECLKAFEREKIAGGMLHSRESELRLREMQKWQMEEKRAIQREEQHRDWMWHQLLVEDVRAKEQQDSREFQRRRRETLERRAAYEEQVASASAARQRALQRERDAEVARLDDLAKRVEQEHVEAIRRKKEQQLQNKRNFVKGHELKAARLQKEKLQERAIDENGVRVALEGLERETERRKMQVRSLRVEKTVCLENYHRERGMASALSEEADKIADRWKREEESKTDERRRQLEENILSTKKQAAADYRGFIAQRKKREEEAKRERADRMRAVDREALAELRRKTGAAEAQLRGQAQYRSRLDEQMEDNRRRLEHDLREAASKEEAFTKEGVMFKDVMGKRFGPTPMLARTSTNPVHPFKRVMESNRSDSVQLPFI